MSESTALASLAPLVVATALRAAVALAVVAVVQTVFAHWTSAALRHALWATALGAVLVLAVAEHPAVRERAPAVAQVHRSWTPTPTAAPSTPTLRVTEVPQPTPPTEVRTDAAPARAQVAPPVPPTHTRPVPWADWLVGVWLVGALASLVRLAASALAASAATRRATPHTALSAQAGVAVRVSDAAGVPYAWGLVRPVVVVPADFASWSSTDRQAALAHEAAHARRRDPLVGLVARAARALHWPDPLAHYAVHRLDRERERAADDAVLRGGVGAADYADLLLRTARRALGGRASPRLAPAHAGPGRSALAERVGAVLDGRARRAPLSRAAAACALGVVVALAAVLSAFGTVTPEPAAVRDTASGSTPAGLTPPDWYRPPATAERWAPELHSSDGWTYTPTFTPDLRTAYYVLWHAPDYSRPETSIQELYVTRWSDANRVWSPPERVPATAGSRTDWPHVSPDGRRLFLSHTRPHPGHYGYADGRSLPPRTADFDLWAADLDAAGTLASATLAPLRSPDLNRQKTPENARRGYVHNETAPRTDRAGRLYFWTERLDDGGGRRDVYLAEPDGAGAWQTPQLLPFNTARQESGVAADPDGRWIVIASEGRGGLGHADLFVVARDGDGWREPVNLGPEVNTRYREDSPEVSPDGRSLFFSTNRPGQGIPTVDAGEGAGPAASVFWVDLHAVPAFRRATGAPRP